MTYALWCAGIGLAAAAAHHMTRIGIQLSAIRRYMVLCAVLWTLLLISRPFGLPVYLPAYTTIAFLLLLAKSAAIPQLYRALCANYPKQYRRIESRVLGAIVATGILVAFVFFCFAAPVRAGVVALWLWHAPLLFERYISVAIMVVALVVLLFPRTANVPVPRFALRAARLMAIDSAACALATWSKHDLAYQHPTAAALIGTAYMPLVGFTWLFLRAYSEATATIPALSEQIAEGRQLSADVRIAVAQFEEAARFPQRF